jgi:DNA-binding response OmpR family regulator
MSARILIVEDDPQISANIYDYLSAKGFIPDAAPNPAVALHLLAQHSFDLVVLDLGLPGIGGLNVARQIREVLGLSLPIVILTARDTLDDKQAGFDAGADDYLLKPFSLKELEMRIKAQLRRATGQVATATARFGAIEYHSKTGEVTWLGQPLKLAPKTVTLLQTFLAQPQTLFSREQLERAVWGREQESSDALRYHLSQLRKALVFADGTSPIQTIHGRGYMLVAHAED